MVQKVDRTSLTKLLSDAIPMLCKNSLPVSSAFRIEAMIGVTLLGDNEACSDDSNVVLICIKQTVDGYGLSVAQSYGETEADDIKPTIVGDGKVLEKRSCVTSATTTTTNRSSAVAGTSSDSYSAIKQEYYPPHMYDSGPIDVDAEESGEQDEETYDDEQDLYDPDENPETFDSGAVENQDSYCSSGSGGRRAKKMRTQYEHYETDEFLQTSYDQSSDGFEPGRFQSRRPQKQGFLPQKSAKNRFGSQSAGARKPRMKSLMSPAASFSNSPKNMATQSTQPSALSVGDQRGMLSDLCRTIASQSTVAQQFICHICNAHLSSKGSLVTHIKGSHIAASMFNCEMCGESFKWYMQLHRHRKRYHAHELLDSNEEHAEFSDATNYDCE